MVVRNDSPVRTTADLKKYQSKIKFLFVRPFSASGYVSALLIFSKMCWIFHQIERRTNSHFNMLTH